MTTDNIIAALYREFASKNHRYFCSNTFCMSNSPHFGYGESDFLSITRAGLITETEIKRSRSDFHADFKKVKKHNMLKSKTGSPVQYFYFACPEDMISLAEVPEYAGLIYIYEWEHRYGFNAISKVIKPAPQLNKNHATDKQKIAMYESLQHKFYRGVSPQIRKKK